MSEEQQIDMPVPIQQLITSIKADRKKLLKDAAFGNPEQLRQFIGQFLLPRMVEVVELMTEGLVDVNNVSLGTAHEVQRVHAWAQRAFQDAGIDSDDELPGVDVELLSELGEAFMKLGALLEARLPKDAEVGTAFQACAGLLTQLSQQLMGGDEEEDGDEEEEEEVAPAGATEGTEEV